MSYLGLVRSICRDYLPQVTAAPAILEIGVDKGQSMLPIVQNVAYKFDNFVCMGIDILIQLDLVEQISQFENVSIYGLDDLTGRDVILIQENSLSWLSRHVSVATSNSPYATKFDLVFIDGDHNYHTVLNELKLVQNFLKPTSLIICDDYGGRWSEKDLFYSEREEYKSVDIATPRQESEKQGVKPAIDDFIASSLWEGKSYNDMAAIILYREDVWQPIHRISPPGTLLRDCKFKVERLERSNHSMPDSPVLRNTRSFPSPVVKFKSL